MEQLLTEKQVAERLGLNVGTMQQWRFQGKGPKYYKFSPKAIRYRLSDVEQFIDNSRVVPALTEV